MSTDMSTDDREIMELLERWKDGDGDAIDKLMPLIFDEVRELARRCFRGESPAHTLQPTAVVNEVYLQLVGGTPGSFENREQFLGYLATVIRNTLKDHARRRSAQKRGGDQARVPLEAALALGSKASSPEKTLAVAEAIEKLTRANPRQGRIAELRYYLGLSLQEISDILGTSRSQVYRDWGDAKEFLMDLLRDTGGL
jgi:RNA polymerase sigma-70 factor (ECF subfamily)